MFSFRWDGAYQMAPVMTNWMASVYNRETFVNVTDMIVVKQISGGVESANVRPIIVALPKHVAFVGELQSLVSSHSPIEADAIQNRITDRCRVQADPELMIPFNHLSLPGANLPHVAGGREGLPRRPRQRLRWVDRHG